MKIIKVNHLPRNVFAIDIYNVFFVSKTAWEHYEIHNPEFLKETVRHESIHTAQMKDFCRFIPIGGTLFYLVYLVEWGIRLCQNKFDSYRAYRAISFEREAYDNDHIINYLATRKRFAQWR